jgi:hypothetical protein
MLRAPSAETHREAVGRSLRARHTEGLTARELLDEKQHLCTRALFQQLNCPILKCLQTIHPKALLGSKAEFGHLYRPLLANASLPV